VAVSAVRSPVLARWRVAALAVAALVVGSAALVASGGSRPTAAEVVHAQGFEATVLGWTSWYGSYDMGALGAGWCIDHGLRAPDPALAYVPTDADDLSASTKAAMAWAVTTHGPGADAVRSAALMLVLHDLRGAVYPYGRIDVDTLTTAQLAGFGDAATAVLAEARTIKADALAHAERRAPATIGLTLSSTGSTTGVATATLTDASGARQVGVTVQLGATGAVLDASQAITGADGSVHVGFRASSSRSTVAVSAQAVVADPAVAAYAPTAAVAQRVVVPRWVTLHATATWSPPATTLPPTTTIPPTTTSTVRSTTTTIRPTTTTIPPSTTAVPPTTTIPPTTTVPPTSTTVQPTTTTAVPSTTAPASLAPQAPAVATLPRTGNDTAGWAAIGFGLVLMGTSLACQGRRGAGR
jgi:hypothetical protein